MRLAGHAASKQSLCKIDELSVKRNDSEKQAQ